MAHILLQHRIKIKVTTGIRGVNISKKATLMLPLTEMLRSNQDCTPLIKSHHRSNHMSCPWTYVTPKGATETVQTTPGYFHNIHQHHCCYAPVNVNPQVGTAGIPGDSDNNHDDHTGDSDSEVFDQEGAT